MKRVTLLSLALIILMGCGGQRPTPTPAVAAEVIPTHTYTPIPPTATLTPMLTDAPQPTHTATPTLVPTDTLTMTPTPTSTSTATPTPRPPTSTPTLVPTATPTMALSPTSTPTPIPTEVAEPDQIAGYPHPIAYTQITETGAEIFSFFPSDPPQIFQLTETSGAAYRPRWSPDARFIAWFYYDPDTDAIDLWLTDNLSGSSRPISTGGIEEPGLRSLGWSSDSRFLIYTAIQPDGLERDIYRLDVESGEIVNLTADCPVWDSEPAWSPDGALIAFVSDRVEDGKGLDDIWVMRPDGTELRNVTNSSDWEDIKPGWSPEGTEIAFYRWSIYASDERGPSGLWVTKVDGSEERLLIQLDGLFSGFFAPAWSPDGRFVAYQFGPPDEADVYVIPAAGGEAINVSNLPGDDYGASWSPDSQSLIFTNSTEEDLRLYIAAPDGTGTRPLLDYGGNGLGEWAPALRSDSQ